MLKGKLTAGTLTVENHDGALVIAGSDNVDRYRILVLRSALRLEVLGMSHRGRSVYSIVKREFGFKGNKQTVLDQLEKFIEENIKTPKCIVQISETSDFNVRLVDKE